MKEYIRAKQIYNMEKEYEERIAIFETSPMDDSDLGIWHQYLDFAEKEGDHEKVYAATFFPFPLLYQILIVHDIISGCGIV